MSTANMPKMSKSYVPPSLRKVEPSKAAVLESEDLKSTELFPSLKTTPTQRPGATWARLRERLAPPAQQEQKPSENQFAALDDDEKSTTPVGQATPVPLNFKTTVDAAIKREAAAAAAAELQAATEDPLEMTSEQLTENGWASLSSKTTKEQRLAFAERLYAAETRVAATECLFRYEPFETVGIPRAVLDSENPHDIFVYCMGAEAAGPDPWERLKPRSEQLYTGNGTADSEAAARAKLLKFISRKPVAPVA